MDYFQRQTPDPRTAVFGTWGYRGCYLPALKFKQMEMLQQISEVKCRHRKRKPFRQCRWQKRVFIILKKYIKKRPFHPHRMFSLKKDFKTVPDNLEAFLLQQSQKSSIIWNKAVAIPFILSEAAWAIPPGTSQQGAVYQLQLCQHRLLSSQLGSAHCSCSLMPTRTLKI